MVYFLIFGALFMATFSGNAFAKECSSILIKNANVLRPSERESFLGGLLIKNGVIAKIYRKGEPATETSNCHFDAEGKWLLPGFMDLHTHNWGDHSDPVEGPQEDNDVTTQLEMGRRMLLAGQTSYLDLFAPNDAGDGPSIFPKLNTFHLRSRQRSGEIIHPNVYVSGPLFVVEGGHAVAGLPDTITIKVAEEGKLLPGEKLAQVARETTERVKQLIKKRQPDVVKFVFNSHKDSPITGNRKDMPLLIAKAIIRGAREKGVKTVAHVGTWDAVEDLARAGVSAFTHLPNGAAPASTLKALSENNVTAITTISIYLDIGKMKTKETRKSVLENALLKLIAPLKLIFSYWSPELYAERSKKFMDWSEFHNQMSSQLNAVKSLFDAKIKIVAGSDGGNVGTFIGYTLHRELHHMSKAGMDNWSILQAATSNSGRFMNNNRGRMQVGKVADLVLLNKNPLDNIRNTQTVEKVILGGKLLDLDSFEVTQ